MCWSDKVHGCGGQRGTEYWGVCSGLSSVTINCIGAVLFCSRCNWLICWIVLTHSYSNRPEYQFVIKKKNVSRSVIILSFWRYLYKTDSRHCNAVDFAHLPLFFWYWNDLFLHVRQGWSALFFFLNTQFIRNTYRSFNRGRGDWVVGKRWLVNGCFFSFFFSCNCNLPQKQQAARKIPYCFFKILGMISCIGTFNVKCGFKVQSHEQVL